MPDGTSIEYVHGPSGRRIAKKVDGTVTEKYLWLGLTTLLAVYDGSDNLIQRFEYADGRMPIRMTQEGVIYYLGYDQVGSLRVISDSSGNVVKRIDYDSFGNIVADTNESFTVPFGFAGGLQDRDTDLVRFGYRDFDPDVGRWTAKDPIFFSGGDTDLYGYVQNDPVNYVDPNGLFGLGGAVSGAIGGLIGGAAVGAATGGAEGAVSGAFSGFIIGGVMGFIAGPSVGINAGTIGASIVSGLLGEMTSPTETHYPIEELPMDSDVYREYENFLIEFDEALNDPDWVKVKKNVIQNACN